MRVVIQRVRNAEVLSDGVLTGNIGVGLLVLCGFEDSDDFKDLEWMVKKIIGMRIFCDPEGHMNLSIDEVKGEFLVISQFTLFAETKKGNRPSFMRSAKRNNAKKLYDEFLSILKHQWHGHVRTGVFGADMQVTLCNDGPVTIIIDSKNSE